MFSKFFNYVQKDTLIDWLEKYGVSQGFKKENSLKQKELFASGVNLEAQVVEMLKAKINMTD